MNNSTTPRYEVKKIKNEKFDYYAPSGFKVGYTVISGYSIWDNVVRAFVILDTNIDRIKKNYPSVYDLKYITQDIVNQFNSVGPSAELAYCLSK